MGVSAPVWADAARCGDRSEVVVSCNRAIGDAELTRVRSRATPVTAFVAATPCRRYAVGAHVGRLVSALFCRADAPPCRRYAAECVVLAPPLSRAAVPALRGGRPRGRPS